MEMMTMSARDRRYNKSEKGRARYEKYRLKQRASEASVETELFELAQLMRAIELRSFFFDPDFQAAFRKLPGGAEELDEFLERDAQNQIRPLHEWLGPIPDWLDEELVREWLVELPRWWMESPFTLASGAVLVDA
jgi:hypothetical protein